MRDEGIGTLLIADGEELIGLVTDRDITVRIVPLGGNVEDHSVIQACSENRRRHRARAIDLMRRHATRRLPVTTTARSASSPSATWPSSAAPHCALADIRAAGPQSVEPLARSRTPDNWPYGLRAD
ncbi:CBS domain-containing protein [Streptomyces sp. NPDC006267]|uniref:CBS domain-containing protein n=1 Tax=Streptomyces sp. NPDC006267 TaxID=3157173 RepID=UPI0033A803B8